MSERSRRGKGRESTRARTARLPRAEDLGAGSNGGANTADMATITLQLGLVTGSTPTVTSALARLYSDLNVVPQPSEGIQHDGSFHQHGAELLSGSYGAVFSTRMLQVHTLTANTSLTMPPDKLESFARLLLDGQQWVTTASGDWALAVIGRSISAPGRHRVGLSTAAIRSLPVREAEMAAFATTLEAADIPVPSTWEEGHPVGRTRKVARLPSAARPHGPHGEAAAPEAAAARPPRVLGEREERR